MKPVRACPVCPECNSKRFIRLAGDDGVVVQCRSCGRIIKI